MRQLVTIREVADILPIPNADAIELAMIDGWQCVVKKGEFKKGDRGVFFEIDSFLPQSDSRFSFLGKTIKWRDKEGYRLKTIKLRGALSQGLLLPTSLFPELLKAYHTTRPINEDGSDTLDLAALVGVEKWERDLPACLSGQAKGNFPSFLRKTDQERVQNLAGKIDRIYFSEFEVTVKLDGSSMTSYLNEDVVGVCSRNLDLKLDDETSTFVQVFKRDHHAEILKELKDVFKCNIAMQGELMGPGIQGNREALTEPRFFVFDLFNIDKGRYIAPGHRQAAIDWLQWKGYAIDHVPVLYNNSDENPTFVESGVKRTELIKLILELADGPSMMNNVREGIVFKTLEHDTRGEIFSFKAISNKYLLGGGE